MTVNLNSEPRDIERAAELQTPMEPEEGHETEPEEEDED